MRLLILGTCNNDLTDQIYLFDAVTRITFSMIQEGWKPDPMMKYVS